MSFDLLPWETLPEAPEQATETIAWKGGELVLPRLGYLTVTELQGIRAIDPQNALYRLITAAAVELCQAIQANAERVVEYPEAQAQADEFTAHRCYGLLTRLLAQEQGASIGRLSPEEQAVQVLHAGIIGPFLEEARAITNRVVIRSVTVILNRIQPFSQSVSGFESKQNQTDSTNIYLIPFTLMLILQLSVSCDCSSSKN